MEGLANLASGGIPLYATLNRPSIAVDAQPSTENELEMARFAKSSYALRRIGRFSGGLRRS
jgi:hypothetical protein